MSGTFPSSHDIYLFHQGNLFHSYRMLGAHPLTEDGLAGTRFTVWAPNAREVRLAGSFNGWQTEQHPMHRIEESGLWTLFVPGVTQGDLYKYEVHAHNGEIKLKADPYAFYAELRPNTASIVYPLDGYEWGDIAWNKNKKKKGAVVYNNPLNIYEVHLGTWKIKGKELFYTYEELATELVDYAVELGYTHIELLPVSEHPFDRSWGYQITGYFAVTSRYGTPDQFKMFVDRAHQQGVGVIVDWVPGHFCKDDHGLRLFDGTPQFEPQDPRIAEKKQWGTLSFDFGKPEVMSFLISNALFWMDVYHVDGLRVDAVASMLYLGFGNNEEDPPLNRDGGQENLEAVDFLRKLNETVFSEYPQALMMAEDSTDWPLVTGPTDQGGLGFNYKWNMGWMNDVLEYMETETHARKHRHNLLTFSFMYTYSENYVLPFSHDEVVHGKKSLLDKMPGDYWQKFAGLRTLYGYQMAHPGKKLLFMGGELGHFAEWKDLWEIDWFLLDYDMHAAMHRYVKDLNHFYQAQAPLWQLDHSHEGFQWIDADDEAQSIVSFIRQGVKKTDFLICVTNFTPATYMEYRVGVPRAGTYTEVLNSDAVPYGGSGQVNSEPVKAERVPWHNQPYSITMKVPPLAAVMFEYSSTRKAAPRKNPSL
ncbi:1,4-alpha-glucan branching protein [Paenibacillus swuensis]|uniref:1,4-alpha-glucan branching enzyme GlgB n=1 Tax=Paenibacillus swuensis TaxID=1178515 RepID=A0A172TEU9_9BACL|nr:1,4-alpha-glucan branching protein GlgB [Paenibacillus swuensis]ANE45578.1 1,4-alpha-glucan branching protein [Paenibacillus swuensis]